MAEECRDLPHECWELIFDRVDHHTHFEPLSLVCKRFLAITNHLRRELAVTYPTILVHGTISGFLRRFRNLKSIDLSHCDQRLHHHSLDYLVSEIANSSLLDLQTLDISNQERVPITGLMKLGSSKMRTLKVLKCADIYILRNSDLDVIATSLPCLEELDISYPRNACSMLASDSDKLVVTDRGIEVLSSNLKNLRKINISGSHFISDKSLMLLSSNCVLLREIKMKDCTFLSGDGINFLLHNSPNLCSISMSLQISVGSSLHINWANSHTSSISNLDLWDMDISDESLYSLAKACLPLKRLCFSRCTKFTFSGISLLLYTYQSLEYLALVRILFLTDQSMCDLSKYLHELVSINLNSCDKLGELTFFVLAENCPLLRHIEMAKTAMGKQGGVTNFVKYRQIQSLKLARNLHLSDECLKRIGLSCPRLQLLDVRSCLHITGESIAEVLKSCPKIRQLQIDGCEEVKNVETGCEVPQLEVLNAAGSGINDEGLMALGKRCCNLLILDLEGCRGVTTKGVQELVRNCKRLKQMNLKFDHLKSDSCMVDFMAFARPSLRKILVNCDFRPTLNTRRIFLKHGFLIDWFEGYIQRDS